jgi:RNA polymerase sigma factor (TIGR02999 family)
MTSKPPGNPAADDVTALLQAWGQGDVDAGERLFPLVYAELRRQARRYMRGERAGHTLQPTALAHEAYLRLAGRERAWADRAHFFAVAARVMRQVLVDHARRHRAAKRDGLQLSAPEDVRDEPVDLLDLDAALAELAELDSKQVEVVEMRFFAGLSVEETAEALGLSPRTVKREWSTARAWLKHRLRERGPGRAKDR